LPDEKTGLTMWLFTRAGYFSIAQDANPDYVMVRARRREDLERLVDIDAGLDAKVMPQRSDIEETRQSDYRYRLRITKGTLGAIVYRMVCGIDYKHFKEVTASDPGRDAIYEKVWQEMRALQQ
jgi:hypothetical protein